MWRPERTPIHHATVIPASLSSAARPPSPAPASRGATRRKCKANSFFLSGFHLSVALSLSHSILLSLSHPLLPSPVPPLPPSPEHHSRWQQFNTCREELLEVCCLHFTALALPQQQAPYVSWMWKESMCSLMFVQQCALKFFFGVF
ncbi:unnamed protein product [Pleuronectes platessa]|uniref:Uncharacterized protein n=1 Tax=Pleuronectes platessa TaxID=8262 RepID=A0A9N7VI39_PLEPL|nr:unnamed protein product [Pleuronectes platessa]